MNMRKNKLFWSLFILFCIVETIILEAFDLIDLSKMDAGADLILTTTYLLVGICMRLWIKRNPKEIEKLFKIPEE